MNLLRAMSTVSLMTLLSRVTGLARESLKAVGFGALAFLETGALVFFMPGDSLLVTTGLYAAAGKLDIVQLNLLLIPMAILGDAVSYFIGKKAGPALFSRPRSRFFNPEHLRAAHVELA